MKKIWFPIVIVAFVLGGCAGLQQFPEVSENYTVELKADAPDYAAALTKIYKLGSSAANTEKKTQIRNEFIETRMAVIDTNFQEFEIALSQENVQVDFVVSVAEVAVGGAGALVSETASQILSAVSAGLAGGQAAYSKAALYDQALSALHAQMIASRKAVLVRITERKKLSYDDYWLSDAKNDLHDYFFAGSLPGAIVGTAADAADKEKEADEKIRKLAIAGPVPAEVQERRVKASDYVWDLVEQEDEAKLRRLASALGVPEDEDALDGILDIITVARTAEDVEVIEQAVAVVKRE